MMLTAADVVADPAKVADADPATLPAILAQLTTASAAVAARMITTPTGAAPAPSMPGERLLTAPEAATMLNVSPDWCYRSATAASFRVKLGSEVRFSLRKILAFIERNRG